MATYKTSDSIGERESLADVIERIDPDETPIFSNAQKVTTSAVFEEWLVQELTAASAANYQNEGVDFSYTNPTAAVRFGNYHQISIQAAQISNTLDIVNKAGRDREEKYVQLLKAIEQRRDIEKSLFANEARSSSDPRKTAKFMSWITNVDVATSSAAATGDGSDAATVAGTNRALTLAQIENVMKDCYEDGSQPDMLVVSPANKVAFSDLSGGSAATNQINMTAGRPQDAVIVGSVSVFLTDFGELNVVIDRQANDTEVFLMDSDYYKIGHLPGRMFDVSEVAPTGDSVKFGIVSEWCLLMPAPKAHGYVGDLST